jgi:hypothetical protein
MNGVCTNIMQLTQKGLQPKLKLLFQGMHLLGDSVLSLAGTLVVWGGNYDQHLD